ncbi:PLP-dependent aminotransferase family protein [Paralcaligenes ureilyticus]|uniref:GntR family transcriptional regulator/MocR family aminotransferase n=1 Tax=Paralcaligenes ureilyticus TaxID=627131 RepID=A0A4R3LRF5_9BURK|nr:PLP-dependent aminotransferase family protein [Paralcaligenes ureilyticus]TCT03103.1 GntR family transcriptional regulator/MocR family aminotransferase [Paralcaligenes ureilyticus]
MKPSTRTIDIMWSQLFLQFEKQSSTLQGQLRDMLMHAVIEGFILPGETLPSSRLLAQTLGLSRTTVMLALQALADKGIVVGQQRSGYVVAEQPQVTYLGARKRADEPVQQGSVAWESRLMLTPSKQQNIEKPADWQQQPFPFIYGQFDASLFPIRDWRECVLESLQPRALRHWAPDHLDRDNEPLVEQIQRRLLPARGIWVERDEILVTAGAQQATFLLSELLIGPNTRIGIENPGYPDARNNFSLRSKNVQPLAIDGDGLVPNAALSHCDYVYVTPSHQCPTTVTMSLARRRLLLAYAARDDFVVIEDDHESELNFSGHPTPALKSLDTAQRVIYVGSLSKTLAHGLRLGFVVAPAELIRELRSLRRLMMRHVPTNNQQSAASFIAHGHHEAFMRRLNVAYRHRAAALHSALEIYTPELKQVPAQGGSALWVTGPPELDTRKLAQRLYARGVVVEPGDVFFTGNEQPQNHLRIGYSSIAIDRIEPGVRIIAEELVLK